MPRTPPRSVILASCVPEPPEDEVLEWTPTEAMETASAISLDDARLGTHASPLKATLPSGVASEGRNATSRRVYDEATSLTDVASPDNPELNCPFCLNSGKRSEDSFQLYDGIACPSMHAQSNEDNTLELNNVKMTAKKVEVRPSGHCYGFRSRSACR